MSKDKVSMPSSTAGITRYFDDYKSKIEIRPETVVALCIAVIVIATVLRFL
ncbi:MAG: preprotein translocase subunit Sec61beta [Candidatus Woesearchaeota archaeon]